MSSSKKLKDFKAAYCNTLIPEPNSKGFHVKVAIKNYNELSIIRTNLLSSIDLITRFNEISSPSDHSEIVHSIGTLVQLLRSFGLEEECDGLTELFKKTQPN